MKILLVLALAVITVYGDTCWDKELHVLNSLTGVITDHTGGGPYKQGAQCQWVIRDPQENGTPITLRFKRFNLRNHTQERYDFVDIRDGPNASAPELLWFTGSDLPPVVVGNSGALYIRFYSYPASDDSVGGEGFELEYSISECKNDCMGGRNGYCFTSVCNCKPGFKSTDCSETMCANNCGDPRGKCDNDKCVCEDGYYGGDCMDPYCEPNVVLDDPKGTFTDHHQELSGKNNYLHNAHCSWLLTPELEDADVEKVRLRFTQFETEEQFDFVVVHDGPDFTFPVIANLSGTLNKMPAYTSTGPALFITFTTDVGLSFGGFEAEWEAVPVTKQGGTHSTMSLVVTAVIFLIVGALVGAVGLMLVQRYHSAQQQSTYTRLPMDDAF
eukprot:CAMPEP_0177656046 /NCGR_PEP_ID=MMETSP0447-20121125/15323_1 /TAXON_ID=0 /ORGANISM="Stygamoeba regulata, Strain BSH-02190019" /LENGTH=384 /DNA_ID=CAMNT_0019160069 /DNA_START=41 /DNA_END=1195 /DNA_ORIENTATION=+